MGIDERGRYEFCFSDRYAEKYGGNLGSYAV